MNGDLNFRLPGANWRLAFTQDVLVKLSAKAQTTSIQKESVGQLYARDLTKDLIVINHATVLPTHTSSRAAVAFDIKAAQNEREQLFITGFHCVGLWHTHPEPCPHPSQKDLMLAGNFALAASQNVNGIVFVIVGTGKFPSGLTVGLHDGERFLKTDWVSS